MATGTIYRGGGSRRFARLKRAVLARPVWAPAVLMMVNLLVVTRAASPLRAAVVLPVAVLLPGQLTLRALGLHRPPGWDALLHRVAFGLLWLLAISFVVAVLPGSAALSTVACLIGFDLVVLGLTLAVHVGDRLRGTSSPSAMVTPPVWSLFDKGDTAGGWHEPGLVEPRKSLYVRATGSPRPAVQLRAGVPIALAAVAVVFAVVGAIRLNAGHGPAATELAFGTGAAPMLFSALLLAGGRRDRSDRTHDQAAATTVYLLGLAVLLATSLRGAGVTGHDIKMEYRVFQDTLVRGRWEPGAVLADYNSCLSLTTLPSFLYRILGVAPLDVFRVVYQLVFAIVPVGVFLIARRLLPTAGATLAAGLFIAFPTFVNDMPMLNRQEIALVFFAIAILTLVDGHGSRGHRIITFIAMAAGFTVSHYSSTYVTAGTLLFGWLLLWIRRSARSVRGRRRSRAPVRVAPDDLVARLAEAYPPLGLANGKGPPASVIPDQRALSEHIRGLRRRIVRRARSLPWLARFATDLTMWRSLVNKPHLLALRLVAVVIVFSAGWSVYSGSGSGLVRTVQRTVVAMETNARSSSDAVGYSFFHERHANLTDEQALTQFITSNGAAPDEQTIRQLAVKCPTALVPADSLPTTRVGRGLTSVGVPPPVVNHASRQCALVLFEFGAAFGVTLLWIATRRSIGPAHILAVLGAASLVMLAATVVLPQLSVDYGLLRLYQQSLVLLAPSIVLALTALLRVLTARHAGSGLALVVTACFVTTSGLLPQLIGGYPPQLNLNNAGSYYHAWYTSRADVAAANWARGHLASTALVSADSADTAKLRAMTRLTPLEGVAPGMVPENAYLAVEVVGPDQAGAVAIAGDRILVFTFPLDCVAAGRPLLYDHGEHRIYGPGD